MLPIISFARLYATIYSFVSELIVSYLPLLTLGTFVYTLVLAFICRKQFKQVKLLITANLFIVLIVTLVITRFYSVHATPVGKSGTTLTVLSYNINALNSKYEQVAKLIRNSNADVLSFYEFQEHQFYSLSEVLENYPYTNFDVNKVAPYAAVFSKYPIKDITRHHGYDRMQLILDKQSITLYFVHATVPLTPKLFNDRNQILEDLKIKLKTDKSTNILVSGDFNLTPWSYYYSKFTKNLSLTNITANHLRFTWHGYNLFFIPLHIDHTFISANLLNNGYFYKTLKESGSDHKPQLIKVKL